MLRVFVDPFAGKAETHYFHLSSLCACSPIFLPAGTFICLAYYFLELLDNSNGNSVQCTLCHQEESEAKSVKFKCDHNLSLMTWPVREDLQRPTSCGSTGSSFTPWKCFILIGVRCEGLCTEGTTDCVFEGVSVSEGRIIPQLLSNFSLILGLDFLIWSRSTFLNEVFSMLGRWRDLQQSSSRAPLGTCLPLTHCAMNGHQNLWRPKSRGHLPLLPSAPSRDVRVFYIQVQQRE